MSRSWSTCEALTFGRVPEKDYRALEESFVIVLAASHDMQVKAYVKGKRVYLEFKQPGDALELLWQEVRIHNQLFRIVPAILVFCMPKEYDAEVLALPHKILKAADGELTTFILRMQTASPPLPALLKQATFLLPERFPDILLSFSMRKDDLEYTTAHLALPEVLETMLVLASIDVHIIDAMLLESSASTRECCVRVRLLAEADREKLRARLSLKLDLSVRVSSDADHRTQTVQDLTGDEQSLQTSKPCDQGRQMLVTRVKERPAMKHDPKHLEGVESTAVELLHEGPQEAALVGKKHEESTLAKSCGNFVEWRKYVEGNLDEAITSSEIPASEHRGIACDGSQELTKRVLECLLWDPKACRLQPEDDVSEVLTNIKKLSYDHFGKLWQPEEVAFTSSIVFNSDEDYSEYMTDTQYLGLHKYCTFLSYTRLSSADTAIREEFARVRRVHNAGVKLLVVQAPSTLNDHPDRIFHINWSEVRARRHAPYQGSLSEPLFAQDLTREQSVSFSYYDSMDSSADASELNNMPLLPKVTVVVPLPNVLRYILLRHKADFTGRLQQILKSTEVSGVFPFYKKNHRAGMQFSGSAHEVQFVVQSVQTISNEYMEQLSRLALIVDQRQLEILNQNNLKSIKEIQGRFGVHVDVSLTKLHAQCSKGFDARVPTSCEIMEKDTSVMCEVVVDHAEAGVGDSESPATLSSNSHSIFTTRRSTVIRVVEAPSVCLCAEAIILSSPDMQQADCYDNRIHVCAPTNNSKRSDFVNAIKRSCCEALETAQSFSFNSVCLPLCQFGEALDRALVQEAVLYAILRFVDTHAGTCIRRVDLVAIGIDSAASLRALVESLATSGPAQNAFPHLGLQVGQCLPTMRLKSSKLRYCEDVELLGYNELEQIRNLTGGSWVVIEGQAKDIMEALPRVLEKIAPQVPSGEVGMC